MMTRMGVLKLYGAAGPAVRGYFVRSSVRPLGRWGSIKTGEATQRASLCFSKNLRPSYRLVLLDLMELLRHLSLCNWSRSALCY